MVLQPWLKWEKSEGKTGRVLRSGAQRSDTPEQEKIVLQQPRATKTRNGVCDRYCLAIKYPPRNRKAQSRVTEMQQSHGPTPKVWPVKAGEKLTAYRASPLVPLSPLQIGRAHV